jgi:cytochrome c oxidase subunit 3
MLFLVCQAHEYSHASYSMDDGIYATLFFGLTGLHGLHVIAGLLLLLLTLWRMVSGRFLVASSPSVGVTAAVLYWHFVDIV